MAPLIRKAFLSYANLKVCLALINWVLKRAWYFCKLSEYPGRGKIINSIQNSINP